jgi:alcohol dehydrogenase class IV
MVDNVTDNFRLARIPEIIFGRGDFLKLAEIISGRYNNILIVTGGASLRSSGMSAVLEKQIKTAGIEYDILHVKGEPSPLFVNETVQEYRSCRKDAVVSIGGGSVIDAGKAVSAMFYQDRPVEDYLEGIGPGAIHDGSKLPFIAVPTTSGTGSEATKNAVLSSTGRDGFKKSIRHNSFIPDMAVIDPELTVSCPRQITAACGMDAFVQLLESYVSAGSSVLTDLLAYDGIRCI